MTRHDVPGPQADIDQEGTAAIPAGDGDKLPPPVAPSPGPPTWNT